MQIHINMIMIDHCDSLVPVTAFQIGLLPHCVRTGAEKEIDAALVSPSDWLPAAECYYRYAGSMSAPDCTEAVTWFVFSTPVSVSANQVRVQS